VTRKIAIVAFDGAQALDVIGPAEVFSVTTRLLDATRPGATVYRVELVSTAESITTSSGVVLGTRLVGQVRGALDTLVVAGGTSVSAAIDDPRLLAFVQRAAGRSRRVTSVCTGAFVLAAAGLLDGRRATTHWASCARLADRHPGVTVEPDAIYVRDGNVWTSAGVTAGMDLALALVKDDHGRDVALEVARWLVLYARRTGGQSQFSAPLAADLAHREPLRDLQAWIAEHPGADLSVGALARRANMSARHFARAFRAETGVTPGDYVERVRVDAARRLLEGTTDTADTVARHCGFGTAETMQRTFRRQLHVTPTAYRRHFAKERP
jgi:transcriptional regulator GlxA family with amidase domain